MRRPFAAVARMFMRRSVLSALAHHGFSVTYVTSRNSLLAGKPERLCPAGSRRARERRRIAESSTGMSDTAAYEFENGRGFTVVAFNPSIADAKWGDIEQVGNDIRERLASVESPVFLVDLTRLQYMGSSVVALIVKLWKAVGERNGGIVVINSSSVIHEVLDIAGLTRLWTIVETREEAERVITRPPFSPPSMIATYLLAVFGWVAAAGASGVIAAQQKDMLKLDITVVKALALVCAGLAAVTGITSSIRDNKGWRVLGILLVLVGGMLIGAGILLPS